MSEMIESLLALDDDDFSDAMKSAAWNSNRWADFVSPEVIDRTQGSMRALISELQVQKTSDRMEVDPEWARSVNSLLKRMQARMGVVNSMVKDLNRQETGTVESVEKKWSAFAEALATAVEGSEADYLLDDTLAPSGELTMRSWLSLRRKQAERKALKGII